MRMLRRHVYLDEALAGQVMTCYETLNGLKARSSDQRVQMFRDYYKWYKRYWWNPSRDVPDDLRFEPNGPDACPRIAVAYRQ